jgi:hypothetical protein
MAKDLSLAALNFSQKSSSNEIVDGVTYVFNLGSGIPEMKTILRGTVLKRYLSIPTLIAKVVCTNNYFLFINNVLFLRDFISAKEG